MAATLTSFRRIAVDCPQCGRLIHLTTSAPRSQPDGWLAYDPDDPLPLAGVRLHMQVGCEGTDA
jgi:hypothetical protein